MTRLFLLVVPVRGEDATASNAAAVDSKLEVNVEVEVEVEVGEGEGEGEGEEGRFVGVRAGAMAVAVARTATAAALKGGAWLHEYAAPPPRRRDAGHYALPLPKCSQGEEDGCIPSFPTTRAHSICAIEKRASKRGVHHDVAR
ncbi:hypothetical protein DFH09DRAFT_1308944 [Mycena vulgaris]|nr:hypothetical protein DFH09DRAFT_1308944 [Mycena vulgaris]